MGSVSARGRQDGVGRAGVDAGESVSAVIRLVYTLPLCAFRNILSAGSSTYVALLLETTTEAAFGQATVSGL